MAHCAEKITLVIFHGERERVVRGNHEVIKGNADRRRLHAGSQQCPLSFSFCPIEKENYSDLP